MSLNLKNAMQPGRRLVLQMLAASAGMGVTAVPGCGFAQGVAPFDFNTLTQLAQELAAQSFLPPKPVAAAQGLNYDAYRAIRVRTDAARWQDNGSQVRILPYPLGWLFTRPVSVFDVSDGTMVPMTFTAADFMPDGMTVAGAAGIRLNTRLNRPDKWDEVASFLGASYFRGLGRGSAYGVSARGIAIDSGLAKPEEFPAFRAFYLDYSDDIATVYALLDGPSVTGAYRFIIRPGQTTTMDVAARLFFRQAVEEVGITPLTSMFFFSPADPSGIDDYRPAVHDSEGLQIVRRDGDRLWRQLNNPPRLANAYFAEDSPASFGLYQRARSASDYEDPGALYHRRPSLRVEPAGDWGRGHVRLIEIPTNVEANDNIVAFWVPEEKIAPQDERSFSYRLSWGDLPPDHAGALAVVAQTRSGLGGVAGVAPEPDTRKFVVDFQGGPLAQLDRAAKIEPVLSVDGGTLVRHQLDRLDNGRWRLVLDIRATPGSIVEMAAHLAGNESKLTEIWLNQWVVA